MPAIPVIQIDEQATITPVTLDGSTDTIAIQLSKRYTLIVDNATGGSLTPNVIGSEASAAYQVPGVGDIDLSGGFNQTIADGEQWRLPLTPNRTQYLQGSVSVTGGTGLTAYVLEY